MVCCNFFLVGILAIPGSAPVNRRRSGTPGGGSIDDNFLASMIFDTPTKPTSHGPSSPSLQKSPLHKSTSALNEMPVATSTPPSSAFAPTSFGGPNEQYTPGGTSNYQGHSRMQTPGYEHSHSDYNRFRYDPMTRFMVGGGELYADEYDISPPGSTVSASGRASVFSPPSNVSRRSDQQGLKEFDLADAFLQHFSNGRGHQQPQYSSTSGENHTHPDPPPTVRSEHSFAHLQVGGHRSNVSDNVIIATNSSPISRFKRASSPNIGFPAEGQSGYIVSNRRQREYSPESYNSRHMLYGREDHQHPQYAQESYRNPHLTSGVHPHSYQTPSPIATAPGVHSNYAQQCLPSSSRQKTPTKASPHSRIPVMSRKAAPNHHSSPQKPQSSTGHTGQTRNAALWYDDNSGIEPPRATQGYDQLKRVSGGSHVTSTGSGGVQRIVNHPIAGQVPTHAQPQQPHPQGITMPRQHSEECYNVQEMLNIWDNSSKSPFGEGTLV